MKKNWYVVQDFVGRKDGFLSQKPKQYRKNKIRYKVHGPFTIRDARFQLFGAI